MVEEILKNKKLKQIIKVVLFSILSITLVIIVFKNFKVKKIEEQQVKINLNKSERTNYPKEETLWAKLEIKSLKIDSDIYRGNEKYLNYGILHHKESYFPSDNGTIVLVGNTTYLKDLSKIKPKEEIKINTLYGTYKYKVEKTEIKNKEKLENELEIKNNEEQLIIYTSYPDTPGYKSDRFVVYARPVGDNK